jgi:hypothetical protein
MTEPTPLPPELLDELLSAQLDGDLDAAARDLGIDPATARSRIAATPGADDRRDALDAARAAVAVPPLDADRRDALLRGASGTGAGDELATRRARHRWVLSPRLAAAAAAVVAVVGVVGLTLDRGGGDDAGDAARPATLDGAADEGVAGADARAGALAAPVDFGDVTDPAALRARVVDELGDERLMAEGAPSDDVDDASRGEGEVAPRATEVPGPIESYTSVAPCAAALAAAFDLEVAPVRYGTGTYDGAPAEVVVFDTGGYLVIVADPASCAPLATQLLRPEP